MRCGARPTACALSLIILSALTGLLQCVIASESALHCAQILPPGATRLYRTTDATNCSKLHNASSSALFGLRKPYTAPTWACARGVQCVGCALRMRRFVSKLLRGDNVTVSVAGGSISRGWADSGHVPNGYKGCATVLAGEPLMSPCEIAQQSSRTRAVVHRAGTLGER